MSGDRLKMGTMGPLLMVVQYKLAFRATSSLTFSLALYPSCLPWNPTQGVAGPKHPDAQTLKFGPRGFEPPQPVFQAEIVVFPVLPAGG